MLWKSSGAHILKSSITSSICSDLAGIELVIGSILGNDSSGTIRRNWAASYYLFQGRESKLKVWRWRKRLWKRRWGIHLIYSLLRLIFISVLWTYWALRMPLPSGSNYYYGPRSFQVPRRLIWQVHKERLGWSTEEDLPWERWRPNLQLCKLVLFVWI